MNTTSMRGAHGNEMPVNKASVPAKCASMRLRSTVYHFEVTGVGLTLPIIISDLQLAKAASHAITIMA